MSRQMKKLEIRFTEEFALVCEKLKAVELKAEEERKEAAEERKRLVVLEEAHA